MYTKQSYSIPIVVSWTRRYIYLFVITSLIPVILYEIVGWKWLHLPWLPIGLIGTVEGMGNDVPITTISRAIEIDIREMIGDDKKLIPAPHPQYADTQM